MSEGKVLEIIADKKKWVSVSAMGGCYVECVDVNRGGLKLDCGNGYYMTLPNQSWKTWFEIHYTEEDRRDPDRNYISPEEGLVCDVFGNVLEMDLVSKSGHVNFHYVDFDYNIYMDENEEVLAWEEHFSEKYNPEDCECCYCSLAKEWVEKIELLILKGEIERQYKDTYLHESKTIEPEKLSVKNGNGKYWEFEDEKLPLKLSKSHEIVSPDKVTRKKKRKHLRREKQKKGKILDDRHKNHHFKTTKGQAIKFAKQIDQIFIYNHPLGRPPKLAVG